MRIHGRLIIYGEYLMHNDAQGLIVSSSQYLATPDDASSQEHPTYQPARDRVAALLSAQGYVPLPSVRGNLQFGCGFASSTVLTHLHLAHQNAQVKDRLSRDIDHLLHGFEPSGVDTAHTVAQRSGLFGRSQWEVVDAVAPPCSAIILPAERKRTLAQVRERVDVHKSGLIDAANGMSSTVRARGEIEYDALLDYSQRLALAGVYSDGAQEVCDIGLARGVAVKGTGGLYDKALLVFWPPGASASTREEVRSSLQAPGAQWIDHG